MKKDWAQEAKKRINADYDMAIAALLTQRAVVSKHVRESYRLSKTQLQKRVQQQDEWFRAKLIQLNTVVIVLERRRLLGKVVWWLYGRLVERMNKPTTSTMQPVAGAVPIEQREPPKGAEHA